MIHAALAFFATPAGRILAFLLSALVAWIIVEATADHVGLD